MLPTFKEKYGKRIARMRKARFRLSRALKRHSLTIEAMIADGELQTFDYYSARIVQGRTVRFHLTFRGMREIWIRLFPKPWQKHGARR